MKKLLLNLSLLAALFVAISFQSCKKEEVTPTPVVKTNKELLQSGIWKLTAETTDGKDSFGDYKPCDKDNTRAWGKDGIITTSQGALKCDESEPQLSTTTYTLAADEKSMTIKDPLITLTFKIVSISETTLKLEYTFLGTVVETYTKQ